MSLFSCALMLSGLSVAVHAADFERPEFWSKKYFFPEAAVFCSVAVAADDDATADRLGARLRTLGAADVALAGDRAAGFIAADKTEDACRAAVAGLRITAFSISRQTIPETPELYEKRDHLQQEQALLSGTLGALPSVSGLLNAELSTLDALIERYESARRGEIAVRLGPTSAGPTGRLSVKRARRLLSARASAAGYWARADVGDPCASPSPGAAVVVEVADLEAAYRRATGLRDSEEAALHAGSCRPKTSFFPTGSDIPQGRVELAVRSSDVAEVQHRVLRLGRLISWNDMNAPFGQALDSAPEKIARLRADLNAASDPLKPAPYLRSLVAAEIRRLEPLARRSGERNKIFVIQLTLQEKEPARK